MHYSVNWYYRFLKELVDFFGKHENITFIYKEAPSQKWAKNSIISYIKDKKFKNIILADKTIAEYLPQVNKVIMDFPSTPLFEVAAFGTKAMVLFRDMFTPWKPAVEHFGKSAQSFSDISDAIEKIDLFLKNDGNEYFAYLPTRSHDAFNVLSSLKKNDSGRAEDYA